MIDELNEIAKRLAPLKPTLIFNQLCVGPKTREKYIDKLVELRDAGKDSLNPFSMNIIITTMPYVPDDTVLLFLGQQWVGKIDLKTGEGMILNGKDTA